MTVLSGALYRSGLTDSSEQDPSHALQRLREGNREEVERIAGSINRALDDLAFYPRDPSCWRQLAALYFNAGIPELATDAFIQASLLNWRAIQEAPQHANE